MKTEIKISDELLSVVLGCECEFKHIRDNNIHVLNKEESILEQALPSYINLDTFIRLGKIWAFENGYEVVERSNKTIIRMGTQMKTIYNKIGGRFVIETVIEALEWVNTQVKEVKNG